MHKNFKTTIFFLCAMDLITVNVMAMGTCSISSSVDATSMTVLVSTGAASSSTPAVVEPETKVSKEAQQEEQKGPSSDVLKSLVRSRDWSLLNQVYPLPVYKSDVTRNLILIINTKVESDIDLCITMLALALHSKAAPIIVSGTTLQSFLRIQRKKCFIGVINALKRTKGSWRVGDGNNPLPSKIPKDSSSEEVAVGLVPFVEQDWCGYINKQSDFVLLIPKQYLAVASTKTPVSDCGFNEKSLESLNFKEPQVGTVPDVDEMMKGLESMFETKSSQAQAALAVSTNPTWKIYCVGHGMPAECKSGCFTGKSVFVTGLLYKYFINFISFLHTALPVSSFHYLSCYSGGRNQDFINQALARIDPSFYVLSHGSGDLTTSVGALNSAAYGIRVDSDGKGCVQLSSPYSFATYFSLLNTYFLTPTDLTAIAGDLGLGHLDPLAVAIYGLVTPKKLSVSFNAQPFVRRPHGQQFDVLAVSDDMVMVTDGTLDQHMHDKTSIDAHAAASLIVYPKNITVPLVMGLDTVFISRLPSLVESKDSALSIPTTYTAEHNFATVTAVDCSLWRIISNMVRCNGMYKSTFTIDTLSCKNYTNSGLEPKDAVLQARNVTIAVKGIEETYTHGDWGKEIYPGTITIKLSIGQTTYVATWNRGDLHANIDNADGLQFEVQRS